MGTISPEVLILKQSPLKRLRLMLLFCDILLQRAHPWVYARLYAMIDFFSANVVITLALCLNFQSRQFGALVAIVSSLAITTTTVGIREIFRARAHDGAGPGAQIATAGMLVFPFILPVFVKFSQVYVGLSYLLVIASLIVLVGETIVARRAPLPMMITPTLLAIGLAPVLVLGSYISSSIGIVMAITLFYAVFVMVVFSVLSAGKVLRFQLN